MMSSDIDEKEELNELFVQAIEAFDQADKGANKFVITGIVVLGLFSLMITNHIMGGAFSTGNVDEGLQSLMHLIGMPIVGLWNLIGGIIDKVGYKAHRKKFEEILEQLEVTEDIELSNSKGK